MTSNESSPSPIDQERRKRIVVLAGIALALVMVLAFLMGNPFRGDKEESSSDTPIHTVWPTSTREDDQGNWMNQPNLPVLADTTVPTPPMPEIPTGPQTLPPPVTGGETLAPQSAAPNTGSALAQNSPAAAGGTPAVPAPTSNSSQASPSQPAAMPQAQTTTSDPVVAATTDNSTAPSNPAAPQANPVVAATTDNSTAPSNLAAPQANPNRPSGASTDPGSQAGSSSMAADPAGNKPAAVVSDAATSAPKAPSTPAATAAAQTNAPPAIVPEFVAPPKRRGKIIAQTKNLITQAEVGGKAAQTNSSSSSTAPAKVPQEAARQFASQTTQTMREKGLLKPGQIARLPRRSETPNTKVWRDDDQPTSTTEQRPFGIVIAEDEPAASANPAFTPEGIPLRTDIPPGTSPLIKTGPDKPLWKRPE